ncbi:MAG: hypothetical protein Q8K92_02710 [Leadbetterella sp.]|nr:hypothetical protein [Leadbetterella sp.]
MEQYSLEKARNEADEIRKMAFELKDKRGEIGEPGGNDYKNAELFKFFETKGYTKLRRIDIKSLNNILFAEKDGQECFIKKFQNWQHLSGKEWERANNELACYENLPKDILIDVVEINAEDHYVALKKEDFQDFEMDTDFIIAGLELGLNRFPQIDASFLPETTWECYVELFEKIKKIEMAGLINNADAIIGSFQSKKAIIDNAKKGFSHQDFSHLNIKKVGAKIKVFDFEFARCDNAMYDMATFLLDIKNELDIKDNEPIQVFHEKIIESEFYDEYLFNLMLIRRAVLIVSNFLSKGGEMSKFVQKNLEIIQETSFKILE